MTSLLVAEIFGTYRSHLGGKVKNLLFFTFLFAIGSVQAIWLKNCRNTNLRTGEVVSWNMERCIQDNFWYLGGEFDDVRLERCQSWPKDRVSLRFTRCIERNFNELKWEVPSAFLRHCFVSARDELTPQYLQCVNGNFKRLEREIRFRRHRR
jgi:hypothetical protein